MTTVTYTIKSKALTIATIPALDPLFLPTFYDSHPALAHKTLAILIFLFLKSTKPQGFHSAHSLNLKHVPPYSRN